MSDFNQHTLASISINLANIVVMIGLIVIVIYFSLSKSDTLAKFPSLILSGYLVVPGLIILVFVVVSYARNKSLRRSVLEELNYFCKIIRDSNRCNFK